MPIALMAVLHIRYPCFTLYMTTEILDIRNEIAESHCYIRYLVLHIKVWMLHKIEILDIVQISKLLSDKIFSYCFKPDKTATSTCSKCFTMDN